MIAYFDYTRKKELAKGAAPLRGENAINMFEDMKKAIFPETRIERVERIQKASDLMKKVGSEGIWVKPLR